MSRLRSLVALTAVLALALASVAVAAPNAHKVTKVTGGTTNVTLSSAASALLSSNHITVTPLAPATASGSTFTFPIARGRLNAKNRGFIVDKGGFALSNGTRTIRVRNLTIDSTKSGVSLYGVVVRAVTVGHRGRVRIRRGIARVARVTGVKISNGSATGTVRLTGVSAAYINLLAGKKVATAGAPLGQATVTPTLK